MLQNHQSYVFFCGTAILAVLIFLFLLMRYYFKLKLAVKEINRTVLGKAYRKLKSAQNKLVVSEKMASIGMVTAGIIHEISNPISYVNTNIAQLSNLIADLEQKLKNTDRWDDDLQNDFQDINLLLGGSREGARRTIDIVKNLRRFSRVEGSAFQTFDVHEGIDSSLEILMYKIRPKQIQIEKEFKFEGKVDCRPGRINQVFLNILHNACKAVPEQGMIRIKTQKTELVLYGKAVEAIEIRFWDNGKGMPDEIQGQILDPFYSSDADEDGIGLGLSISIDIVKRHNGKLKLYSKENKFTEFIVILPVYQNEKDTLSDEA